jgi:hypothetical protein
MKEYRRAKGPSWFPPALLKGIYTSSRLASLYHCIGDWYDLNVSSKNFVLEM